MQTDIRLIAKSAGLNTREATIKELLESVEYLAERIKKDKENDENFYFTESAYYGLCPEGRVADLARMCVNIMAFFDQHNWPIEKALHVVLSHRRDIKHFQEMGEILECPR